MATLKKILEERMRLPCKETSKYTNFYKGGRVKLQLHPSETGFDLAIPEADRNLPPVRVLKQVDIKSLSGYWGPNKDWLIGNGRFTKRPAVAFHLPEEMKDKDERHVCWQDFNALRKYAIRPDGEGPTTEEETGTDETVDLDGKVFVVDGLNVIRSYGQESGAVSFEAFLSLLLELRERGASFSCVFDANTCHVLRENAGSKISSLFRKLVDRLPLYFNEVTGGIQADPFILMHAARTGYPIISNDRFTIYTGKYPWILKDDMRLIKGKIVGGNIAVPALDILIPINKNVELMVDELISDLKR